MTSAHLTPSFSQRPQTPGELQAWLEAHHLAHVRRVPLAVIEPLLQEPLPGMMGLAALAHLPVTAPLDGSLNVRRQIQGAAIQVLLEAAAWAWLGQEAERVRQGLELEQQRAAAPRPRPTDARLIPWAQALERARARVRESAVPRLLPARPTITLHERPPRLYVEEPGATGLLTRGAAVQVRVVVDPLALLDGQEEALSCWCTPRGPARCIHALSALEALLDMLADGGEAPHNAQLARVLFEVPGQAILAAFDTAVARAPEPDVSARASLVTFRLERLKTRQPQLLPYVHRRLKKGGLSKGVPVSWRDREVARSLLTEPRELEAFELCELLSRLPISTDGYTVTLRALRLLAHSPRLFVASRLDVPLQVREAPLGFAFGEDEHGLTVRPAIDGVPFRPGELLPPAPGSGRPLPWLLFEPEPPRLTLVTVPPGAQQVLTTLREYGGRLPGSVRPVLLGTLARLEATYPVSLPESLEARAVPAQPGVLLRLRALGDDGLEGMLLVHPLPEAPPLALGEGAAEVRGLRGGERLVARRDLAAERTEALALRERLGVPVTDSLAHFTLVGAEAALDFLERLEPLRGPGLRVEWEEQAWRISQSAGGSGPPGGGAAQAGLVRRAGQRGGGRHAGGARGAAGGLAPPWPLRGAGAGAVAAAHRVAARAAPAPGGPDTPHARGAGGEPGGGARVGRSGPGGRGGACPAGLAPAGHPHPPGPGPGAAGSRGAEGPAARLPARGLPVDGAAHRVGRGRRAWRMTWAWARRCRRWPCCCTARSWARRWWWRRPRSASTGRREAARFAPSLRVSSYHEAEREGLLGTLKAGDVLLVSYGLLVRDAERLAAVQFATLVVDEAQAAKNPDTARARALRGLQAEARVALTGTPVENRLSELWSLFRIVFPGLLGSRESFRQRFAGPIEREGDARGPRRARPGAASLPPAPHQGRGGARAAPAHRDASSPWSSRRASASCTRRRGSPPWRAWGARAGEGQRFELLAALTRLRLLACHPRLGVPDSTLPSSKLERLLERVEELRAEGSRALVFSQFVQLLALAREALEARGITLQYLDGQTPPAERQARVEAFQRGEGDVFLISLKAGGTGLNLTAADHVIHLDPWWNPARGGSGRRIARTALARRGPSRCQGWCPKVQSRRPSWRFTRRSGSWRRACCPRPTRPRRSPPISSWPCCASPPRRRKPHPLPPGEGRGEGSRPYPGL